MGSIYHKIDYSFPEGDVTLFFDEGDENEFGYEIDVWYYPPVGAPETILHHSFGYEDWSEGMWKKWGAYVHQHLAHAQRADDPEAQLQGVLEEFNIIYCEYMLLHPDSYLSGKLDPNVLAEHLVDLDQIRLLIEDMDAVDITTLK